MIERRTPLKRTPIKRKPISELRFEGTDEDLVLPPEKPRKPARKKNPTKTQLRKKCDVLHGKIIRSKGKCERCGRKENLQRAHIFSRGYRATEFDDRNCLCLCHPCHFWGHHYPIEWDLWVQEHIGASTQLDLRSKALSHQTPDYAELLLELQQRWKEIEKNLPTPTNLC